MKTSFAISIPKPCSENWDNFTSTSDGGFCGSCSKTVVDFTKMSDDDILNFLNKKQAHTCGRFRADQLKMYSATVPLKINPGFTLFKAGFLGLLLLIVSKQSVAQVKMGKTKIETVIVSGNQNTILRPDLIIRGVVTDESNQVLPGTSIILKGTTVGTSTDSEGRFEFPKKLNAGDVLLFSFIGYDTKEYVVPGTVVGDVEITIKDISIGMDMAVTMGEVAVNDIYTEKQSGLSKWWSKVKNLF